MNIQKLIFTFGLAGILTACAVGPQVPPTMTYQFAEALFTPYAGVGTSNITGQAFSKTKGGDVKYPAGESIYLFPDNPYMTEALGKFYYFTLGGTNLSHLSPYVRSTQIDGGGNFTFTNIPSGSYILITTHTWLAGEYTTGGDIEGKVIVAPNQTAKVLVQ